jgi:cathepsin L
VLSLYVCARFARRRFSIWASNVEFIQRSNAQRNAAGSSSTRLGLTAFTDLTREEFAAAYLGAPMAKRKFSPTQQQQHASGAAVAHGASALLRKKFGQPSAAAANEVQHWRYENVTPPAAADWRTAQPPILGPIKDQHVGGAPCGSCWVR